MTIREKFVMLLVLLYNGPTVRNVLNKDHASGSVMRRKKIVEHTLN